MALATTGRLVAEPVAAPPLQTVTALPAAVNLELYAGDDFYLDLTVTNDDGTPADLTGVTATAEIRATPADVSALASFACTITTNVIHLHLDAADSAALSGALVWDCQIASPDIFTLAAGSVKMTAEVTRP